jgi:DHA2 family multidrug resistance protein-like MFS transporter
MALARPWRNWWPGRRAATDLVLGSVSSDDAGVDSATNSTSMQVGGSIGVAVFCSVLSTRYQHVMHTTLAGCSVPAAANAILGSIGGALAVAHRVSGLLGEALAASARSGFMSGSRVALSVGAAITGAGVLLVLALLPSRPDKPDVKAVSPAEPPGTRDALVCRAGDER